MSMQQIAYKIKVEQSMGSKNHTRIGNETSVKLVQQSILASPLQPTNVLRVCWRRKCSAKCGRRALIPSGYRSATYGRRAELTYQSRKYNFVVEVFLQPFYRILLLQGRLLQTRYA